MSFVVYEQDPLVRYDIIETLTSEFAGSSVQPAEEVEDFAQFGASPCEKRVLIVSLPDGITQTDLDEMLKPAKPVGIVVITNAFDGQYRLPANSYYVQRPFGSDLLIKAVKTVLSDPPEPHS